MAPHFIITVSELRFRVLERTVRPGLLSGALREVVVRDFMPLVGAHAAREQQRAGRAPTFDSRHVAGEQALNLDVDPHNSVEWLVDQIERFLLDHPGQTWAFAAGPLLHNSVLQRLRPSVRGSLVESVHRNLAHTPAAELATHFKVRS
jgi:Protein required for attachment to host cells